MAPAEPGRATAAIGVLGLAVALAVLPALIGLGVAPRPAGLVAACVVGLSAVVGGVKVAAVALGAARVRAGPVPQITAASVD